MSANQTNCNCFVSQHNKKKPLFPPAFLSTPVTFSTKAGSVFYQYTLSQVFLDVCLSHLSYRSAEWLGVFETVIIAGKTGRGSGG